ncbi:MAG: MFS transporter [Proteobacteria bacterium]|nr:MFS transporter [Pseudomonadota bacterium]
MTAHPTPAAAAPAARAAAPWLRVRWRIFLFLFGFGAMAYVQQRSLTVAAYQMMPQLGLSQMQIGWLQSAFLIGYAAMQFPGGVLGQRLGARAAFVLISLVAFAATLVTPLAPLLLGGTMLFAVLLAAQLLCGCAQAPIFPLSAGVFEEWFPPLQWPLVQGLQSMGLGLAAAATPPLVAWLMIRFDWQRALLWSTLPALLLIGGWARYGRNTPAEHPAISAAELAELPARTRPADTGAISWRRIWALVRNRDVLTLTVSYLCMNYAFYLLANWCFLYLVQERHFTVLEGGWLAGAPPLAAALGAGAGGRLASACTVRFGITRGLRLVPLVALPLAAMLLLAAVNASNPYFAVAALSLCFGCIETTEGPYWAAVMHVAGEESMAACGFLNTGGNVGGLIATPIIAWLSGQHAWTPVFIVGAAMACAAGLAWLWVDPVRAAAR